MRWHDLHLRFRREALFRRCRGRVVAALLAGMLAVLGCDAGLLVLPESVESQWWEGFSTQGMDDYVYALVEYDRVLVAGGVFQHAGPLHSPAIASWDGTAWQSVGGGLVRDDCTATPTCNASVRALAVIGEDLVAGGRFTACGSVALRNIGRWNGNTWAPYGDGLGGAVYALAWYQGQLVAGGEFTSSGSDSTLQHLAVWDGSRWTALGGGTNGSVRALLAAGEDLYAGGDFTCVGTDSAAHVARWDGSRWEALGGGVSGSVIALAAYESRIAVAGNFSTVGDEYHSGTLALWDGRFWDVIPSYFLQTNSFGAYGGDLVVGGSPSYYHAEANGVGRWTGRAWRSFGGGIRGTVNALCAVDGHLYLGGYFTAVAGLSSRYIARWDEAAESRRATPLPALRPSRAPDPSRR